MTQRHLIYRLAVLCLLAVWTVGLSAHLAVVKTMPANESTITDPPARIQVWFNQQPSPRISRLEMRGAGGEVALGKLEVDRQDRSISAAVAGSLAAGNYEVSWRTAGDDGHVMRGTFTFVLESTE
jgi:methionine-rich copper-binding protein CopC